VLRIEAGQGSAFICDFNVPPRTLLRIHNPSSGEARDCKAEITLRPKQRGTDPSRLQWHDDQGGETLVWTISAGGSAEVLLPIFSGNPYVGSMAVRSWAADGPITEERFTVRYAGGPVPPTVELPT
jgi:hypothetical protein